MLNPKTRIIYRFCMYQSGKNTRKLYVLWCCWKHGIFREKKHLSQHGIRYTRSWRVWNCGTIECSEFSLSPVAWVGGDGGSGILRTLHVSVSLPTTHLPETNMSPENPWRWIYRSFPLKRSILPNFQGRWFLVWGRVYLVEKNIIYMNVWF